MVTEIEIRKVTVRLVPLAEQQRKMSTLTDSNFLARNKRRADGQPVREVVHKVRDKVEVCGDLESARFAGSLLPEEFGMIIVFILGFLRIGLFRFAFLLGVLLLFFLLWRSMRVTMALVAAHDPHELLHHEEDEKT